MNNFLKFLEMIRNTKIKTFIIILTSILIFIFTYKNQELWLIKNCTGSNSSPSCIYSWQRLYIIPSLVFFLFYIIIWVDKIFLCIKKIDLYLDNLESRRKFLVNAIITVFISIAIFNLRFSFIPLNPFNINWLINNGGDLAIHYMGWFVFRESPWEFPLGIIKNLNYPIGTSVGYTDPIPLLAISLKFLASRVSEDFQYSGIWLFLCYVFQGFFSALILKNWDCKFIFKVFASLLIAITPVFLNRYGHLALDCHWVILASFCLYQSSNLSIKSKILLHSLLLLFGAWVHPYITLILFVLHFSLLISFVLESKYKIIKVIIALDPI